MIVPGDNLTVLKTLRDECVDSVVTDPPYGLSKNPDAAEVLRHWLVGDDYQHRGSGFMGKTWDSFVPGPSVWKEVYRVLKPGGHILAFSGTRTYDLAVLAIRLAGFEIRDQLAWLYGSGFPKSLDVSKAIQAVAAKSMADAADLDQVAHSWAGWGTALKPGQEPIVLARKPLVGAVAKNVLAHGTGGINIDGCRVGDKGGTAGANYAKTGLFGIGGKCEIADIGKGRWPANVLLDEHAAAMLDEQTASLKGGTAVRRNNTQGGATSYSKSHAPGTPDLGYGDSGGASRFFYCAKSSKAEREAGLDDLQIKSPGELTGRKDGSKGLDSPRAGAGRGSGRRNQHPTVKPIALMRYLVRLITPPGGIVLDPYAGSGSTGIACKLEGFEHLGIELEEDYVKIAKHRIAHA